MLYGPNTNNGSLIYMLELQVDYIVEHIRHLHDVGRRWMDVRKAQDPSRTFGPAPTAAVEALREVVPLAPRRRSLDAETPTERAIRFMQTTPATEFIANDPPMPE